MGAIDRRNVSRTLRAVVSGSFHRHMGPITVAVHELVASSVCVLSPSDPRVVAQQGEFLFVASDRVRSVRLVQDRHLECIRGADFVWLVCPDGYVGQSASMEIGFAAAVGVPILATREPSDLTLRQYVSAISGVAEAVRLISARDERIRPESILVDPHASVEEAHHILDRVEDLLVCRNNKVNEPARLARREMIKLRATLGMSTYLQ